MLLRPGLNIPLVPRRTLNGLLPPLWGMGLLASRSQHPLATLAMFVMTFTSNHCYCTVSGLRTQEAIPHWNVHSGLLVIKDKRVNVFCSTAYCFFLLLSEYWTHITESLIAGMSEKSIDAFSLFLLHFFTSKSARSDTANSPIKHST